MARRRTAKVVEGGGAPAGRYTVVRDSKEKAGHGWTFEANDYFAGTLVRGLDTGDYSLQGYEHVFRVERKGSPAELWGNLTAKRKWACFQAELERLEAFAMPFLLLEFDFADVMQFPAGMPWGVRRRLRVTRGYYLKRLLEVTVHYKTKVIPAGKAGGRDVFVSLCKRVTERWPDPPPT